MRFTGKVALITAAGRGIGATGWRRVIFFSSWSSHRISTTTTSGGIVIMPETHIKVPARC